MGAIEFFYIQAPMAVGLLATLGATVIALRQPNYRASRACAWIATGLFMSMAIVWGSTTKSSPWVWIPMIAIIGAMGSVGLVATLRSVASAEAQNNNPPPEPRKDAPMPDGGGVTGNNNGIITHNQSGGQNTIINHGAQPRHLTQDQANSIISELKTPMAQKIELIWLVKPEVEQYALEIGNLLHQAGFEIAPLKFGSILPEPHGILFFDPDKKLTAIAGALKKAGGGVFICPR
jgi:hypothetical protein